MLDNSFRVCILKDECESVLSASLLNST